MRAFCLIPGLLLLAACGGEEWALIPDLPERSAVGVCDRLAGPDPGPVQVERMRAATDSTFLVIDQGGREVLELDRNAALLSSFALSAEGPRGVALLGDAVRSGDSLLVIADAGLQRLRAFRPDGADLWTLQLEFPPQRLAFAGSRLLMTAAGMDARLPSLVYELNGRAAEPLRVPPSRHPDAISRLFLNDLLLEGYPDGSAFVAHHFVRPRAWRVDAEREVRTLNVPVAAAIAPSIGFMPPIPIREEDVARIATPIIAAAPDPATGDLLYLTRSGRQLDGRSEKVLVRADRELQYLGSRLLSVNAVGLVYLPSDPGSAIVLDNEGGWFRCVAP